MSYRSDKIKKALEAKGYTDVKVWYEPLGVALEKCGPSGGWMFSWTERDEEPLGYNVDEALKAISRMEDIFVAIKDQVIQVMDAGHL